MSEHLECRREQDRFIRDLVKEAVAEALRESNLIDGPTHIAHHQALEEQLQLCRTAKRGLATSFVMGLCGLIAWGMWAWVNHGKP